MSTILLKKRKNIGEVILNRPEKLNALTFKMYSKIIEAFNELEEDNNIRVVILSGAGRAFCTGYDLTQRGLKGGDPDLIRKNYKIVNAARWAIWDSRKPVIAKTHGYCIGAGSHLALMCDYTIASEDAQFGESEIQFSEISQFVLVPWLIGMKKAKQYLMTGAIINAREAERIGLVTQVVPRGKLDEETEKLAKTLVKIPSFGLRLTKMCINKVYETQGFRNAIDFDVEVAITAGLSEPEETKEFNKILKEKGAKEAFAYRDKMFEDL